MRYSKFLTTTFMIVMLSGCSLLGDKLFTDIPEGELYKQAMLALEEDSFELAIEKLQLLEARYPFGRYSEQAQLELIYAYYRNYEPEAARAAADRFVRLHPNHENIDYAYYLKGLTAFEQDSSSMLKFLPIDENSRDPGAALEAFDSFGLLLNYYPDSQYAPDARQRMLHLKNRLAQYEVLVGQYYIQRGAYLAAANRGRHVVEQLQESTATADALAVMIESYDALGMQELAKSSRETLAINFPDYQYQPIRKADRSLWDAATFELFSDKEKKEEVLQEKRSWWQRATFGIFE